MSALIYAVLVNVVLVLFYPSKNGIHLPYLIEFTTNSLFSVVLGFGLWYLGIWTAGDGKLFIAYVALLPLVIYSNDYQKWVPSLTLLINIFSIALLVMLVLMLCKIKIINIKEAIFSFLKEFFQPKQWFNSLVYLFAIYWIIELILKMIGLNSNPILKIGLTMLIFSTIKKKIGKWGPYITLIISSIRIIIDKSVYSLYFWKNILILIFAWGFIRSFLGGSISKLGTEIFSKEIRVKELKPGMVLSEVIQKKGKIKKEDLINLRNQKNIKIIKHNGDYYIKKPKSSFDLDNLIEEESEGLNKEQISIIRGIGIKKIKVSQTIPFAPFIFLGVILTIIAKGNILILIKSIL